jgi:hypothetical protein
MAAMGKPWTPFSTGRSRRLAVDPRRSQVRRREGLLRDARCPDTPRPRLSERGRDERVARDHRQREAGPRVLDGRRSRRPANRDWLRGSPEIYACGPSRSARPPSRDSNQAAVLATLYNAHVDEVDDWIHSSGICSPPCLTRADSNHVLGRSSRAEGPDFLIRAYAKALRLSGEKARVIALKVGRKTSDRPRVLHFGASYVVAEAFSAERQDREATVSQLCLHRNTRMRQDGQSGRSTASSRGPRSYGLGFKIRFTRSGSRAMSVRYARTGRSSSVRPCSQSRNVPRGM